MALQLSTSVRNAQLDAIETAIGASAKLMIYTGAAPANCAAATTGTKLAEFDMAADWAAAASGGTKILNNVPLSTLGLATNTAGYFRIFASDGTTCGAQGTVTASGGGGDIIISTTSIASGQAVVITGGTFTQGGA